jgi:muconolactone delta-isomerase
MKFMVQGTLKHSPTPETMALIPAEVAAGMDLHRRGLREAVYIAADLSTAWQVFAAASEAEVRAALATLPLTPFVEHHITALAEPSGERAPGAV